MNMLLVSSAQCQLNLLDRLTPWPTGLRPHIRYSPARWSQERPVQNPEWAQPIAGAVEQVAILLS
jgi:hypothetical protein